MIKLSLFYFILFLCYNSSAQIDTDSIKVKSNPIIFGDFMIGGAGGEANGLAFVFGLNYQINKDLITLRSAYLLAENKNVNILEALLIIPIFIGGDSVNEFSLLYGKRFVFNGSALSISAGVSTNLIKFKETINDEKIARRNSYIGIPFEINFNFFKKEKKRYRVVYGLIPVGKPTSFGKSIGLKVFGNFGEYNYFGIGLNTGIGWHKKY
jgi:hypothetical protein